MCIRDREKILLAESCIEVYEDVEEFLEKSGWRRDNPESVSYTHLLAMCGNIVLEHENETRFCVEILFQLLNRQTCLTESLDDRIKEVRKYYTEENGPESIRYIPVTELVAPRTIDFRNWNYVVVDGLYYTCLLYTSRCV